MFLGYKIEYSFLIAEKNTKTNIRKAIFGMCLFSANY